MTEKPKLPPPDTFLLDHIYSDPASAFFFQPRSLDQIKDDCLVFLDTNVLLIPYATGKDSLEKIAEIYSKLLKAKRLLIPKRVIQEFESNAPEKLKEIFLKLHQAQNINFSEIEIPLLGVLPQENDLRESTKNLQDAIKNYRSRLLDLVKIVKDWHHDDPVKSIYRQIFDAQIIAECTKDKKAITDDLLYRWANKLPPGFQDDHKADMGVGDLLIWETILEFAKKYGKDVIFVTGDSKNDWWHISNKTPLYARRELVEEFRHTTNGKTIRLLSASDFFRLFGAPTSVVTEIAKKEHEGTSYSASSHIRLGAIRSVFDWFKASYNCTLLTIENSNPGIIASFRTGENQTGRLAILRIGSAFDVEAAVAYFNNTSEPESKITHLVFLAETIDEVNTAVAVLNTITLFKFTMCVGRINDSDAFFADFLMHGF